MAARSDKGTWVAIDGPAGSGKTTVGRRLARELGFQFINTGAMYRAVAWGFARGLKLEEMDIALNGERVLLNGEEITEQLYNEELDQRASLAARDPQVRSFLIKKQRELAQGKDVVMEGRDIGTVVLPEAEVKIFLDASLEERARRRLRERGGSLPPKGKAGGLEEVKQELRERDERDRGFGRLAPPPDAIIIPTDGLSVEQVVAEALEAVRRALAR
ncbi:MAG: (d)CMP kinase [Candidatus Bipolaricaulia bacterium]